MTKYKGRYIRLHTPNSMFRTWLCRNNLIGYVLTKKETYKYPTIYNYNGCQIVRIVSDGKSKGNVDYYWNYQLEIISNEEAMVGVL